MSQASSFGIEDGESSGRPTEEIDLYDRATAQTAQDDILGETNVGLGNYTKKEYWMQVESYRKWVFTHAAVSRPLNRRVVDYALTQAAIEAWNEATETQRESEWKDLRPDDSLQMDRRRWIKAKKADLWDIDVGSDVGNYEDRQEVKQERRQQLIQDYGRGDVYWSPPFGRMLKMRHEASRSIKSRLLDNLFGRVSVKKLNDIGGEDSGGLLGGSNEDTEYEQ